MRGLVVVCLCLVLGGEAEAQLFGPRTLGQPFQGRRGAGAVSPANDSGALQGNERFLRDNRSRNAFVGNARSTFEGFVGSQQAVGTGRVPAATESLRPPQDPSRRLNRPHPTLGAEAMYFPRLEIDFEFEPRAVSAGLDDVPLAGLSTRLSEIATSPVRARQVAGVTILSGQVNSVSLAEKLAIIASFEPGVERIENRIEVR